MTTGELSSHFPTIVTEEPFLRVTHQVGTAALV
ncbi:MAG: hypothetical protein QOF01_5424, partial [Thermomicrobiales bacterium]|nr:hypothetical protein [Thermomicrobiales bacterium]